MTIDDTLAPEPADEVVVSQARRILTVDRRYLRVCWRDQTWSVSEARELLEPAMAKPPGLRTPFEQEALRALYLLAATATRLEQVRMRVDLDVVRSCLVDLLAQYQRLNPLPGLSYDLTALSDPELIRAIGRARAACDGPFLRVLEIDGETWFRRELITQSTAAQPVPNVDEVLAAARQEIVMTGDCFGVITSVMKQAAEDDRHRADHATLMCPRGINLHAPQQFTKADFAILVVFPDTPATWEETSWRQSQSLVRRAMFAHHSAKKAKIAYRLYGTGRYTPDPLSDDLGSLGIYYNEDVHHKGHQAAGVSTAMRSVMTLSVRGGESPPLHSLTDWRLSRNTSTPEHRFSLEQFTSFHHYGLVLRSLVELAHAHGCVFPPLLGEWRG